MIHKKSMYLFVVLAALFVACALIAEIIGVKIFQLETTFGFTPLDFSILGFKGLSLQYTCGVIIWPIIFIMTDIINEYFGLKGVRFLSYLTTIIIGLAFVIYYFAIHTSPALWWIATGTKSNISNMNDAYKAIIGQGSNIIIGSMIAFLFAQLIDIFIFRKIKLMTGEKYIWLRANLSTLVSQLIDSFVVLFIAFYIAQGWSLQQVFAIGLNNYFYKLAMAILLTPLLYLVHILIEKYLGKELATSMKQEALHG